LLCSPKWRCWSHDRRCRRPLRRHSRRLPTNKLRRSSSTLLPTTAAELASCDLTNIAIVLLPHGAAPDAVSYRYDKHQLVPFSEMLLPGAAWLGRYLGMEDGGLEPGPRSRPLGAAGGRAHRHHHLVLKDCSPPTLAWLWPLWRRLLA